MSRAQAPMSASRIEHSPYDIETPSYDIETGPYETLAHTGAPQRDRRYVPSGALQNRVETTSAQPLRRFRADQEALSQG